VKLVAAHHQPPSTGILYDVVGSPVADLRIEATFSDRNLFPNSEFHSGLKNTSWRFLSLMAPVCIHLQ